MCGSCLPNHTRSGDRCVECPPDDELYLGRTVGIVLFALSFVAIWCIVTIRPLVQLISADISLAASSPPEGGFQFLKGSLKDKLKVSASQVATVTGVVKVLFTFFQVTSCFLTTYVVPWPTNVAEFFTYSAVVKADIFTIPSIACLSREWDKLGRLLVYTVTPPILVFLLALPVLLARVVYHGRPKIKSHQFRALEAGFYNCFLVFLFVLYPIISISVLDIYNCVRIGSTSWLANDLRLACPYFNQRELLFVWTVIATILFPVGIPLLMLWSLYHFRVPHMSREKTEREALNGMLAKFQDNHKADIWEDHGVDCTVCALVFSILERRSCVPSMLDASDFTRVMLEEFDSAKLEYEASHFIHDCAKVFDHFDADRDGRLSQQEHANMACAFRPSRHDDLTTQEIKTLLAHKWGHRRAQKQAEPPQKPARRPSSLARIFPAKPLTARDRLVRHCLYLQEE